MGLVGARQNGLSGAVPPTTSHRQGRTQHKSNSYADGSTNSDVVERDPDGRSNSDAKGNAHSDEVQIWSILFSLLVFHVLSLHLKAPHHPNTLPAGPGSGDGRGGGHRGFGLSWKRESLNPRPPHFDPASPDPGPDHDFDQTDL